MSIVYRFVHRCKYEIMIEDSILTATGRDGSVLDWAVLITHIYCL